MTVSGCLQTDGSAAFSYLEFGAIDPVRGSKIVWDFRTGGTAYDWFMLARYSNDLVAYQRMTRNLPEMSLDQLIATYGSDIHHSDDFSVNLGKLLAVAFAGRNSQTPSFFELGQTLFGCIDGMVFCQALLEKLQVSYPSLDLRDVEWTGLDISEIFNQLAPLLHSEYRITTFDDISKLKEHYDVFFAKGVTLLYAVRTVESLFDLLDRSDLAVFDYSLALGDEQQMIIGTGKAVAYLSLKSFLATCRSRNKSIYMKRGNSRIDHATNRLWIDALYGDKELCRSYISSDRQVRDALAERLAGVSSERLLDSAGCRNGGWITLDKFLEEQCISLEG